MTLALREFLARRDSHDAASVDRFVAEHGSPIVEGDTITFRGGDYAGCVGAVVSADEVTGSCGDGCTFDLTR